MALSAALLVLGWQYTNAIRDARRAAELKAVQVAETVGWNVLNRSVVYLFENVLETFAPALGAPASDVTRTLARMEERARQYAQGCGCEPITPTSIAVYVPESGELWASHAAGRSPLSPGAERAVRALADSAPENMRNLLTVPVPAAPGGELLVARVNRSVDGKRMVVALTMSYRQVAELAVARAERFTLTDWFPRVEGRDSVFHFAVSLRNRDVIHRSPWTGTGISAKQHIEVGPARLFNVDVTLNPAMVGHVVDGGLPTPPDRLFTVFAVLLLAVAGSGLLALRRASHLVQARTLFLSSISHELRTPLTQILLYAESLQESRSDPVRQHRAAEVILRESRRLIHMVENVLLFARGSGRDLPLNPRPQALAPIVRDVLEDFRPLLTRHEARLAADFDQFAAANVDPGALRQILGNLIDNALRYGPMGQQLRVVLAGTAMDVRIMVEDEGPGIPISDRDRVLRAFVRAARPGAPEGTGIGLALVHQLASAMEGFVRIESSANGGTRVVVGFPRTTVPRAEAVA